MLGTPKARREGRREGARTEKLPAGYCVHCSGNKNISGPIPQLHTIYPYNNLHMYPLNVKF